MLDRAEAVDGMRGRHYLSERINRLIDSWNQKKTGSSRLGYEKSTAKKQRLIGLLHKPGDGEWDETTVGLSMRETENEINLLLPGGGEIFQPVFNAPEWSFAPTDTEADSDDPDSAADSDNL